MVLHCMAASITRMHSNLNFLWNHFFISYCHSQTYELTSVQMICLLFLCPDSDLHSTEETQRFEVLTAVTMKNGVFWDVALVKTNVSEELSASFIRVTRIVELGTRAVTSGLVHRFLSP
jgi:hypothetical protein